MSLRGRIGQYALIELLGSGAMGEVYKATDSRMFGRLVAVKILSERLSRNRSAKARFKREVEVASRLEHPNIITIHDRGEFDGRPYFVMEYLEGPDLAEVVRDPGDRTLEDRVELARQVAESLEFAHRHQVVHRDVKPGNILLVRRATDEQAKLVDFGVVHIERSSLTRAVAQPGTFSYMAPEQLRSESVDARTDLFAFGIVLYELFTGIHPFDASSVPLVSGKILTEEPAPPRSRNTHIPSALEHVILKLLEKDAVHRPQSAAEVVGSLRGIARRLRTQSMGTDPGLFDSLDDLNRHLVENLVRWARRKESEGDLPEALRAFDKASGLAPENDRLRIKVERLEHRMAAERELGDLLESASGALDDGSLDDAREAWRKAWILSPDDEHVRAMELRLVDAETTAPEDPERIAFSRGRIAAAERALDDGRCAEAEPSLREILERYPDDALARLLLERAREIARSGIDYAPYRRALRLSERALEHQNFETARQNCLAASRMWPDDDEWRVVDGRIAGRIESEIAAAIATGERLLQEAERDSADESASLERVERVFGQTRRALDLGAPEAWVQPTVQEAERLKSDLVARLETLEREGRERRARAERIIADAWPRAAGELERAQELRALGPERAEDALFLFEAVRNELGRVLREDPCHHEGLEAQATVDQAIDELLSDLEEHRIRERELSERVEAAARAVGEARRLAGGEAAVLERCARRIGDAAEILEHIRLQDGDHEDARRMGLEVVELQRTIERRRDREARRQATVQAAMQEGFDLLQEAQKLAPGGLDEIRRAEERCRLAEQCFGRVLTLQDDHRDARDARELVATLQEHVRSEIRRHMRSKRAAGA